MTFATRSHCLTIPLATVAKGGLARFEPRLPYVRFRMLESSGANTSLGRFCSIRAHKALAEVANRSVRADRALAKVANRSLRASRALGKVVSRSIRANRTLAK